MKRDSKGMTVGQLIAGAFYSKESVRAVASITMIKDGYLCNQLGVKAVCTHILALKEHK